MIQEWYIKGEASAIRSLFVTGTLLSTTFRSKDYKGPIALAMRESEGMIGQA